MDDDEFFNELNEATDSLEKNNDFNINNKTNDNTNDKKLDNIFKDIKDDDINEMMKDPSKLLSQMFNINESDLELNNNDPEYKKFQSGLEDALKEFDQINTGKTDNINNEQELKKLFEKFNLNNSDSNNNNNSNQKNNDKDINEIFNMINKLKENENLSDKDSNNKDSDNPFAEAFNNLNKNSNSFNFNPGSFMPNDINNFNMNELSDMIKSLGSISDIDNMMKTKDGSDTNNLENNKFAKEIFVNVIKSLNNTSILKDSLEDVKSKIQLKIDSYDSNIDSLDEEEKLKLNKYKSSIDQINSLINELSKEKYDIDKVVDKFFLLSQDKDLEIEI